jgi:hypothetical protein
MNSVRIWNPFTSPNPRRSKTLTRQQLARRQTKAVSAAENLLDDPVLAAELEALSVEEYAERKGIRLGNPVRKGVKEMAKQQEVLDRLNVLSQKVDGLCDTIKVKEKSGQRTPNPSQSRIVALPSKRNDRSTKRLRIQRDQVLGAMEDAQEALDDGRYDEAADILDDVLDEYVVDEEQNVEEED